MHVWMAWMTRLIFMPSLIVIVPTAVGAHLVTTGELLLFGKESMFILKQLCLQRLYSTCVSRSDSRSILNIMVRNPK